MIGIVKAVEGSRWLVMDNDLVLESFDDEMKAKRFVEELRKEQNGRLFALQEEAIQVAERSSSLDERREEEVRGFTATED